MTLSSKSLEDDKGYKFSNSIDSYYKIIADYTYDWEYMILPDKRIDYVSPSCKRITGHCAKSFLASPD